ncbi:hypothetical protein C2R22_03375 [Salinigranum rubrum]|uniref:Uncharacterized protein n=1 Tax=Salinigranum rubrum TaxID=755307 RepID=A0A2I8VFW5_9EURY|nr:hypothetical protein C2R22_03375 [Salinigranum rubrum]
MTSGQRTDDSAGACRRTSGVVGSRELGGCDTAVREDVWSVHSVLSTVESRRTGGCLRSRFDELGVEHEVYVYGGANHAFAGAGRASSPRRCVIEDTRAPQEHR